MKKMPDTLLGEFLEIRGNGYLAADGYGKMLEYGSEKIVLEGKRLTLTVRGKRLKMHYMSGDRIGIDGIIRGVDYEPTHT
ncbi:MAG: YabP/YqfC family sporulation protein [Clostridia bacterium]|nr:YabP/YqfC family sporulation protein [Clostridia bacterium]MBR6777546.1 YabP/YqfC family sporulation protein [Clostridia bacterium]